MSPEQQAETPQSIDFGGPLDAALAGVALGAPLGSEFFDPSSPVKYAAIGAAAIAGIMLSIRMWRAN